MSAPSLVIGTAGHIDHGKSTLVRALTGIDPDRLKEEQERGITIDLGFAHAHIHGVDIAFVDVPGHERFVRNMLAGAGGIDAVVLVVAADESVMPQTREHFHICRLLGIDRGVVAITKTDLADRDMLALVEAEVRELVAGTGLAGAPIVQVSARTEAGLDALRESLAALVRMPRRASRVNIVRLPIDRVFTMRGFGAVVTGTLISGRVEEGRELVVLPGEHDVRVRGVQVHGRAVGGVDAPHRIALNLGGIEKDELARGMTIASIGGLTVTRRADARVQLIGDVPPLRHGARVKVHQGTAESSARVLIAAVGDNSSVDWRAASIGDSGVAAAAGSEAYVRLRLDTPLVVTRGDRFVLRTLSPAATIGGGTILDPEPPVGGLRRESTLRRFIEIESDEGALQTWVAASSGRGLAAAALVSRGGLSSSEADRLIRAGIDEHRLWMVGNRLFASIVVTALRDAVHRELTRFHAAHPDEAGMPREQLRERVAAKIDGALFDQVLSQMTAAQVVRGTERMGLVSHQPRQSDADTAAQARALAAIRAAGLAGADPAALAEALGDPARIERLTRLLMRDGVIVKAGSLYFDAAALRQLKSDVQALKTSAAGAAAHLDVGTFKSKFGLTRRAAIPLLEWLDRERITRRTGETRVIL